MNEQYACTERKLPASHQSLPYVGDRRMGGGGGAGGGGRRSGTEGEVGVRKDGQDEFHV